MIESASRLIAKITLFWKHVPDLSSHVAATAGAGWALIGAVDANLVQLWGGVLIALMAALWGHLREQKRRDGDDAERRKLLKVLVDANEAAILANKPLPYPEIVTMLVRQAGIVDVSGPGEAIDMKASTAVSAVKQDGAVVEIKSVTAAPETKEPAADIEVKPVIPAAETKEPVSTQLGA